MNAKKAKRLRKKLQILGHKGTGPWIDDHSFADEQREAIQDWTEKHYGGEIIRRLAAIGEAE